MDLQAIVNSAIIISCDPVRRSVEKLVTMTGLFNKVDDQLEDLIEAENVILWGRIFL